MTEKELEWLFENQADCYTNLEGLDVLAITKEKFIEVVSKLLRVSYLYTAGYNTAMSDMLIPGTDLHDITTGKTFKVVENANLSSVL